MNARNTYIWSLLLILCVLTPLRVSANTPFTDVHDRYWAKDAIQWAADIRLTSGYPNGTFKPEKPITEAQLVTMLVRFDLNSPNSFPVNKGEHKTMGNYRYLAKHYLPLRGLNSGSARNTALQRAYAAKIFAAYQGKDLYAQEAVYYLYTHDLANGLTGKNDYQDFAPTRNLTRAETVHIMYQMSKSQGRHIQGLSSIATGKDNAQYAKPPKFVEEDEVEFERPVQPSLPGSKPEQKVEIDIEKPTLTANGIDETFITFTFRDCNGDLIPYEQELEFEVTSREGAMLEVSPPIPEPVNPITPPTIEPETKPEDEPKPEPNLPIEPEEDPDREFAESNASLKSASTMVAAAKTWNLHVISDGPEVTVKVIAPRTTTEKVDTITVTPVSKAGNCLLPTASANITYVPRAEIQLDITDGEYNNKGKTFITATLARPGGTQITNFNGYLKIDSLYNLPFESSFVKFSNGQATTSFITPTTLMKNEIITTAIANSSVTDSAVQSILEKKFSAPVSFAPPLTTDMTCTNEKPEIGFLIDSSGSMKRNDPERLRVTKTKEFITALQAEMNIATHFTTNGVFLEKGTPNPVIESLKRVKQSGGTNIANGLKVAFNKFSISQPKTLILLTDGKSSKSPILTEVQRAKELGIKIYTIGLGKNLDAELLETIARDTGGKYFFIKENIELPLVYQSILQEINCGIPVETCSLSASIFESPSVKLENGDIRMYTELLSACGPIDKVIVRFSSIDGNLDYELTHRRQGIYMLNKKHYEIQDFLLNPNATFIAYDSAGKVIGQQKVQIEQ
ncbi:VWA domain-containing protein [Sporosarcina ureae]|uniref:VWA domain-containing protein n=1 Tax=Sporosarcina ureae TaxID=1571 RepID=UPI0028B194B6|nr:S-layer homology domain-containing protein [Sporosarcina ureae]